MAMGCAAEEGVFSVGSFSKTNPPEGYFEGENDEFWDGIWSDFWMWHYESTRLVGTLGRPWVDCRAGSGDPHTTRKERPRRSVALHQARNDKDKGLAIGNATPAGVDIEARRWHSVSGLGPSYIMKNILLLCVALTVVALSARGADSSAKQNVTTNNAAADELWQSIQKMGQEPASSDRAVYLERIGQLYGALLEFETRFPSDPRHWDAKLVRLEVANGLAQADSRPTDDAALFALTKEIVASPDAFTETKAEARYVVAQKRMG